MRSTDRAAVVALLGTDFCARTSYGLCRTPLLPLWAAALGASPPEIGVVGAAATITGVVVKFPAGSLSDVIGRGPLLVLGLVVFALGPHLYPLASGIAALLVLRFFHGLATATYGPASMAAAVSLAGERRGEVLAWLSNTKIAGSLTGAFLGGWILTGILATHAGHAPTIATARFHTAWHVAAGLGGVALLLGLFVLRRSSLAEAPRKKGGWRKVARGLREAATNRTLLLVSSTEGLQNVSVGVLEQFLPLYAVLIAGLTPFQAGLLFAIQTGSAIVSKPLFGRLSDRRGRHGLLIAGMAACALPFAAIPWTSSFVALLLLAAVFGVGEALVTASAAALAADVAEHQGLGAAMGAFGTIGDIGHAAGPLLGGAMLAAFGWNGESAGGAAEGAFRSCFLIVAIAMALAALALVRAGPATERHYDPAS